MEDTVGTHVAAQSFSKQYIKHSVFTPHLCYIDP
jgi:hypothetical protein